MTTLFYVADTAAAALLSTGLRTGYAPGLWTTGDKIPSRPTRAH